MNIGELARQTGVSIRSLRYYEAKQLLSARRGENGYRSYERSAIERVRTIQFYLSLGLTTNEILDVVFCNNPEEVEALCSEADSSACPEEIGFYQEKLAEIERQITALEKAKTYIRYRLEHAQNTASV